MNFQPLTSLNETGFSFWDEARNCGVQNLQLSLVVDGTRHVLQFDNEGNALAGPLSVNCEVLPLPEVDAAVVKHTLVNTSKITVQLRDVAMRQSAGAGRVWPGRAHTYDWRFCHTDNVRLEKFPHSQNTMPLVRPFPIRPQRLGEGEDQPFPALYLTDATYQTGLIVAAASQNLAYQVFEIGLAPPGGASLLQIFEIHHDWGRDGALEIAPGMALELDATWFQLLQNTHPQSAYADYVSYLAQAFPTMRGQSTPLLDEAFYCSWNYGVFAEQFSKPLLETARFIAEKLPNMKWFLVDAGYVTFNGDESTGAGNNFLDRFYPDPDAAIDPLKFPRGMRAFAHQVRALGLRPGLWFSPMAHLDSALFREHPAWFLRDASDSAGIIGNQGFLDLSHPEAAAWLDKTLGVILGEWGMDATKMDFWSQNVELRGTLFFDRTQTAVQSRTRLFETVRRHLPDDGVFITCVATGMGNPFIGLHADTYRNTVDIGIGTWHEQIHNALWALPTLLQPGRATLLLNQDSAGVMPEYSDNENQFRLTWCFITMGMQEIGGRLEKLPRKWVSAFAKYTQRCERGFAVRCPDERAFRGEPLPEVLYVDYPAESRSAESGILQSVALFNWTDEPRIVSIRRSRLGQSDRVRVVDFWTEESEIWDSEFVSRRLDRHSALLFDVMKP